MDFMNPTDVKSIHKATRGQVRETAVTKNRI